MSGQAFWIGFRALEFRLEIFLPCLGGRHAQCACLHKKLNLQRGTRRSHSLSPWHALIHGKDLRGTSCPGKSTEFPAESGKNAAQELEDLLDDDEDMQACYLARKEEQKAAAEEAARQEQHQQEEEEDEFEDTDEGRDMFRVQSLIDNHVRESAFSHRAAVAFPEGKCAAVVPVRGNRRLKTQDGSEVKPNSFRL